VNRGAAERLFAGKPLSPTQISILEGLAAGESLDQTGRRLFMSPQTVRTHRRALYAKLRARNAPQAVAIGYESGLLFTRGLLELDVERLRRALVEAEARLAKLR